MGTHAQSHAGPYRDLREPWSPLNSGRLTGRFRRGRMELNEFRGMISHKFDLSLPDDAREADVTWYSRPTTRAVRCRAWRRRSC
ncbi:hypothetical protein [Nonomuraea montanisoli]|uniref:hypothetical protein n=1 Tax=Nonomuraea montanisoli TaxID=2741721 RepID=UPI00196682E7|nr:hypothetical protein [Nonomuraea montanisoli]